MIKCFIIKFLKIIIIVIIKVLELDFGDVIVCGLVFGLMYKSYYIYYL